MIYFLMQCPVHTSLHAGMVDTHGNRHARMHTHSIDQTNDSAYCEPVLLAFDILTHERFKRTLICYDIDIQFAHFRGNPIRQGTKQHLNNS